MRILLVEDDPLNQRLLSLLLQENGHEIVCASDAEEAAVALQQSFDVVLIDRGVPKGGGQAVLRTLRAQREHTPAIAVTGAPESAKKEILALGFDGFLSKPVEAGTFAEEVERIAGATVSERAKPPLEERLAKLRAQYQGELPSLLEAIRKAVERARREGTGLEDAIESAHKIAGSAASFGAASVSEKAAALEDALIDVAWRGEGATADDWSKLERLANALVA